MSSSEISDEHLFKARAESMPHAKTAPVTTAFLNEVDCARAARGLLAQDRATIGLLPLSGLSNGALISERLSRALADLTDINVALLRLAPGASGKDCRVAHAPDLALSVKGCWLGPSLALIVPAEAPAPGAELAALDGLIRYARARVGRAVVDLSSFVATDVRQAFAACHYLDGVALLAIEDVTRENELIEASREIGPERSIGALLLKPTNATP